MQSGGGASFRMPPGGGFNVYQPIPQNQVPFSYTIAIIVCFFIVFHYIFPSRFLFADELI